MIISTSSCSKRGHPEVSFEVDDEAPSAEWLVRYIEEEVEKGERFEPEQTVQIGWMIVQVNARSGGLELLEPDFDAVPVRWRRGLNNTVRHLALQRSVCKALGCEPVFSSIRHAGLCSPQFFAGEAFTMSRDQPQDSDSGWVFAEDGYQGSEGGFLSLYEIAMQRICVIPFLALPPTAAVFIRRGRIEARYGDAAVSSDDNALLRDWAARFS